MKTLASLLLMFIFLVTVSCSDSPVAPAIDKDIAYEEGNAAIEGRGHGNGAQRISVLSRNLYVGTDIQAVITALTDDDPDNDIPVFLSAVETLLMTDFPSRAEALADEICKLNPDAVGLQEVYFVEIIVPPFDIYISMNYLTILMLELEERGLNYSVAAEVTNTDATLPDFGVRLTDHDVILVNNDRVDVHGSDGQLFSNNIGDTGIGFDIVRGWTMIDATISGLELEIWNTHLESGTDPLLEGLRALQAGELISLASMEMPIIMVGDFNDVAGSLMYGVMVDVGGFADLWPEMHPGADGFTSTQSKDLSNFRSELFERIDYVFSRGFGHPHSELQGQIKLTGDKPSDKVQGPYYLLWPSDHAGVYANFLMPPAHGAIP